MTPISQSDESLDELIAWDFPLEKR
jgi:hypothetical protein